VAGCTNPYARAFINHKPVQVYSSGAFVGLVELNNGTNILRFTVKNELNDSTWKEFVIIKTEPLRTSPHDTLVIEDIMMEPSQDLWLSNNDILEVKFKGSPGWEATFEIPGVESDIPMRELLPEETNGLSGIYSGTYRVKPTDEARDERIIFHLKKSFWNKVKAYSKGKVSILPKELPRSAEVTVQRAYLNASLGTDRLGAPKLGFLQQGTQIVINGKVGNQFRVFLTESLEAWIPEEFVELLPVGAPLPRSFTGAINVIRNENEEIVMLKLNRKLPYTSELIGNQNIISVNIYYASANTNWISYDSTAKIIKNVSWKQILSDCFNITVELNQNQYWGYDVDYLGTTLRVRVKRPPIIASRDSILKGIVVALDAGHGGDNLGAIGATGTLEKDITLSVVHYIDSILIARGAKTILTRQTDEDVGIITRVNRIISSKAHIAVSVHCNSVGEAADPLSGQGVSTYYRYSIHKNLARSVFDKLTTIGLKPFGVIGSFNFMINTITSIPNVLVEIAFLSHPEDEILLINREKQVLVAIKIVEGLEEFLKKTLSNKY